MKANGLEEDVILLKGDFPQFEFQPPSRLKGFVTLMSDDGYPLHNFHLELKLPNDYPYCFPDVMEVGGDIPRIPERHVFTDALTLCLGVKEEEAMKCCYGINLLWFTHNVLVPRLAEEYGVMKGGKYSKEYDHGDNGRWEFFEKYFEITDRKLILQFLKSAIGGANYLDNIQLCPCGSKRKFSKCHRKKIFELNSVVQKTGRKLWVDSFHRLNK